MKIPAVVILIFVVSQVCSAAGPFGEFVELHSCDLYTGGCTASAESTLLGRQVFRVWSIESGEWNGQDWPCAGFGTGLGGGRDSPLNSGVCYVDAGHQWPILNKEIPC